MKSTNNRIIEIKNLKKYFPIHKGIFKRTVNFTKAVDGVDFYVKKGETLGLVGESGSGKTTIGKCIVRLHEPTDGIIEFVKDNEKVNILKVNSREMRKYYRHIQMLFQDPYSSLDPRMRIGDIIAEPLIGHGMVNGKNKITLVKELLEKVGLNPDEINKYPHQFSGGQRQRIGIARALIINPDFIICDEPVSALDVSIQAQVLNLLSDLQQEFNLSYLFIAHDLSVVEYISDRIMVMYLGKIVEIADSKYIYKNPRHPYTEALLGAISRREPGIKRKILLSGTIPDPSNPPSGCVYHTRCRYVKKICKLLVPKFLNINDSHESFVACHRYNELKLKGYI